MVVIGLILGMALKGKSLVDAARAKADLAKINKVEAAGAIYFAKTQTQPVWSPLDPTRNDMKEMGLLTDADVTLTALAMPHPDGDIMLDIIYIVSCEAQPYRDDPSTMGYYWTHQYDGLTSYNSCIIVGERYPAGGSTPARSGSTHFFVCHVETGLDDMNDRAGTMRQSSSANTSTVQTRINPAHYADCDALRDTREREIVFYKIL